MWNSNYLKNINTQYSILLILSICLWIACTPKKEPQIIRLNEDQCDHCKMQVADIKFACELITKKGKILLFDDILCLVNYIQENKLENNYQQVFFVNYYQPKEFIPLHKAYLYHSLQLSTPMSGNSIALSSLDSLKTLDAKYAGKVVPWADLLY